MFRFSRFSRLVKMSLLVAGIAFQASSVVAADLIYEGVNADELLAFAAREDWSAQIKANGTVVEIRGKDFSALIELLDCDDALRCKAGVIRNISYQFFEPDRYGFWHWNLENRGATGFGPSYTTLQRYVHFVGVTDLYLREVVGRVWRDASRSFWDEVEKRVQAR